MIYDFSDFNDSSLFVLSCQSLSSKSFHATYIREKEGERDLFTHSIKS